MTKKKKDQTLRNMQDNLTDCMSAEQIKKETGNIKKLLKKGYTESSVADHIRWGSNLRKP